MSNRRLQATWLQCPGEYDHRLDKADMRELTVDEVMDLIDVTRTRTATVEIYLTGDDEELADNGTPFIGLLIEDGKYNGFGLGGAPQTMSFEQKERGTEVTRVELENFLNKR
jgi:hypothetical protein